MSNDDLDRLRRTARPVIFSTGIPEAPYSIKGSSFFAGYGGTTFVITVRHVVRDFPGNKLMFYPTEDAKVPVRIANSWRVVDDANDEDSSDLYIVQADFGHLRRRIRAKTRLLHLDKPGATAWFDERHVSLFFLCGYPSDRNDADYENSKVNIAQVLVHGSYDAMAMANGVHTLRVTNPLGLDFDGLSGSPVFSMRHELAAQAPLRFCGVAIRGSSASGLVQFLEAGVVLLALKEAIAQRTQPRPPSQRRAKR